LEWSVPFTLTSNATTLYNYSFSATGMTSSNTPITATETATMQCNGTGCSLNKPSLFTIEAGGGLIQFVMDLSDFNLNASLTLSESVAFQTGSTLDTGQDEFDYTDPLSITYLAPDGSVVPNLVFYDSNLNGVIPLSGQDFSEAETPVPAALPLFATGLGMVGLLGWRRKRKIAPITAA
jgi:hypothetical protein